MSVNRGEVQKLEFWNSTMIKDQSEDTSTEDRKRTTYEVWCPWNQVKKGREASIILNAVVGSCKTKKNNWIWDLAMWRSLTKFDWSGWSESVIGVDLRKNVGRAFED